MAAGGPGVGQPVFAGNVLQVRFVFVKLDQTAFVVKHYTVGTVTGNVTLGMVATSVQALYASALLGIIAQQAAFRGTDVRRVFVTPPSPPAWDQTGIGVGSVVGEALPGFVSGLTSWVTEFAGRKYRGRSYWPFPGEADSDNEGRPSAGYKTRLTTIAQSMITPISVVSGGNSCSITPVVYHRIDHTTNQIIDYKIRDYWGVQRRRGGAGRPNPSPLP